MVDVRQMALTWLAQVPLRPKIIKSSNDGGVTGNLEFERLTGTSHATMKKDWDKGGIMTACNGFTGKYAASLRAMMPADCKAPRDYLGGFELESIVTKLGMKHAYVKSLPTNYPYPGDICRHLDHYHVSVSLDFLGGKWERANAGQGGPSQGYDIISRSLGFKDCDYSWTKLAGWIDIEVYYGTAPQLGKVPDWLLGWWNIEWEGDSTYYYWYGPDRRVFWTQTKPFDLITRPTASLGVGNYTIDGNYIAIWWASGTVEVYQRSDDDETFMSGTWNNTEEIKGTKL